jgi:hypothetical protein
MPDCRLRTDALDHAQCAEESTMLGPRRDLDGRIDTTQSTATMTGTVLFLDFDGVLHPDPCRDRSRLFEHAPRLAAALAPFDDLIVVLSTSWRNEVKLADLAQHLPRPLRARLAGATGCFHSIDCAPALVPYRRQAECQHWIDTERPGAPWLALDDRASGFQPYCERLILTRSDIGLNESSLNRLCFALMQAQSARATGH